MNERIKQLAEQAGLRFTQLMSNPMVPVVDGKETDLEKFAQLIVAECLNMIENEASTYAEPVWAFELVNDIREHFGVEE